MFELIVEGPEPRQRLRHSLTANQSYVVGRDTDVDLIVPWDAAISRRHVLLTPADGRVHVERLAEASNSVCHAGQVVESCELRGGDQFVLGVTTFHLIRLGSEPSDLAGPPLQEMTFDAQTMRQIHFRDADRQMEVLMHLPEVIGGASTDDDLFFRLTNLLLAGVSHAEGVAIVRLIAGEKVELAHWTRRRETAGEFRPSSRLVTEAIKRQCSVLHLWPTATQPNTEYTAAAELDWAFCTPVLDGPQATWGLYVAGKQGRPLTNGGVPAVETAHLQGDVKFTELVAEIISSVRRLNWLERQQAGLRQFFAPTILSALGNELNTETLAPWRTLSVGWT